MGAVFALYSGWYFWIPKILGLTYNMVLSKLHFWILFLGVNVTFFPQHFLGLQGMPRRISDYPDAYAGWNIISSFGSLVSVIATVIFLQALYLQLIKGEAVSRYLWLNPGIYTDILRHAINNNAPGIEWAIASPPKPHAFTSLPVSSTFFSTNPFSNFLSLWKKVEKENRRYYFNISLFFVWISIASYLYVTLKITPFLLITIPIIPIIITSKRITYSLFKKFISSNILYVVLIIWTGIELLLYSNTISVWDLCLNYLADNSDTWLSSRGIPNRQAWAFDRNDPNQIYDYLRDWRAFKRYCESQMGDNNEVNIIYRDLIRSYTPQVWRALTNR